MRTHPNIRIVEVGPRDGLQNEARTVSPTDRIDFIEALVGCGLTAVECGSFVSPKWVPQMADSDLVLRNLDRHSRVRYPVLVPNATGMSAALAAGAKDVSVIVAASETFSQRNTNCSIDQAFERAALVAAMAKENGVALRGYLSCTLGCPYEGNVPIGAVIDAAERLIDMGCYEVSLSDTIGAGTPFMARRMVTAVSRSIPIERLAIHFHDTLGQALANVLACLDAGVRVVDTAAAGLGGCPYAKGAGGNLATEELLYMLGGMGVTTGVDLQKLLACIDQFARKTGLAPRSKLFAALKPDEAAA